MKTRDEIWLELIEGMYPELITESSRIDLRLQSAISYAFDVDSELSILAEKYMMLKVLHGIIPEER